MSDKQEPSVLSELVETVSGDAIGVLTLNKPRALNALDLEMVASLQAQLEKWKHDPKVAAVVLKGRGDKAFCAGGDVVSMYKAMQQERENLGLDTSATLNKAPSFLEAFFSQEYTLDFCIANYPKPLICWGNGIVMGGGLGLFAAAEFAVVTESARIAMPEITIGLFPDVGGSYFLNKMPKGVGLFLGLTGASFNARDAVDVHLASHAIDNELYTHVLNDLIASDEINHAEVKKALSNANSLSKKVSELQQKVAPVADALSVLGSNHTVESIQATFSLLEASHSDNAWVSKAISTWKKGSPITSRLVIEQLKRAKEMSLGDVFRQEINMAVSCSLYGEFQEGVRALLIDKDHSPRWRFDSPESVPTEVIEAHFSYYTSENNPLNSLGK